jgi:hypothetical protein
MFIAGLALMTNPDAYSLIAHVDTKDAHEPLAPSIGAEHILEVKCELEEALSGLRKFRKQAQFRAIRILFPNEGHICLWKDGDRDKYLRADGKNLDPLPK